MTLEARSPKQRLFRIGRRPEPWEPPDWSRAHDDGTFGNRFDDPDSYYRVLYASSQRLGCYLETLARFRKPIGIDEALFEELAQIQGEDDFVPPGHLPLDWLGKRRMGTAAVAGKYADLYAARSISHLRQHLGRHLADVALPLGIRDIDLAVLLRDSPRILTQRASREAWAAGFDGIFYHSRLGDDIDNWAIFEPFPIRDTRSEELHADDPVLMEALAIHHLKIYDPLHLPNGSECSGLS